MLLLLLLAVLYWAGSSSFSFSIVDVFVAVVDVVDAVVVDVGVIIIYLAGNSRCCF